jgi:hypothetical protein
VVFVYLKKKKNVGAPNYSWDREQGDHNSNQLRQIVLKTLSWKKPSQKKTGGVAQGEAPEFKPQYRKKRWGVRGRARIFILGDQEHEL